MRTTLGGDNQCFVAAIILLLLRLLLLPSWILGHRLASATTINNGSTSNNNNSNNNNNNNTNYNFNYNNTTIINNNNNTSNEKRHRWPRYEASNSEFTSTKDLQNKRLLCNNGTMHQCQCDDNENSEIKYTNAVATKNIVSCIELVQEEELNAVTLQWPWHNLNKWYKNETYERFFKRQIANTVSRYCEKQANKCQGAYLRINEGNIIILKIKPITGRKMNITFVVIKNTQLRELTTRRIMNSTRIRALLIQQKNELKQAFSGVAITSSTISLTKLQNKIEDNTRLLTLVGFVGFFITITYVIAAVKVCRDHYYKKQAKRRAVNRAVMENNVPDYGSCEETPRQKTQNNTNNRNQHQPNNSPEMLDLDVRISEPSPSPVDDRSIQRMFECDPSQLPAEQPLWSQSSSLEEPPAGTSHEFEDKYKENPGPKISIEEVNNINIILPSTEDVVQIEEKNETTQQIAKHKNPFNKLSESTSKHIPKLLAEQRVTRSKTAHEIGNWSSDSEDEQNEVYYRLSEAEDDDSKPANNVKNITDTEDEDELRTLERESSFEATNLYQRLEETPTPLLNNSESTTLV